MKPRLCDGEEVTDGTHSRSLRPRRRAAGEARLLLHAPANRTARRARDRAHDRAGRDVRARARAAARLREARAGHGPAASPRRPLQGAGRTEGGNAHALRVLHRPGLADRAQLGPERRAAVGVAALPGERGVHPRGEARARLRSRHEPHARGRARRALRRAAEALRRRPAGGAHAPDRAGEPARALQPGAGRRRGRLQRGPGVRGARPTTGTGERGHGLAAQKVSTVSPVYVSVLAAYRGVRTVGRSWCAGFNFCGTRRAPWANEATTRYTWWDATRRKTDGTDRVEDRDLPLAGRGLRVRQRPLALRRVAGGRLGRKHEGRCSARCGLEVHHDPTDRWRRADNDDL